MELAGVFQGLGTKTTLISRGEGVLDGFDDTIVQALIKEMQRQKLDLVRSQSAAAIIKGSDGLLTIQTSTGQSLGLFHKCTYGKVFMCELGPFEQVLFATGRVPLLDKLNLPAAGVKLTSRGYIEVDEYQHTSTKGVYGIFASTALQ